MKKNWELLGYWLFAIVLTGAIVATFQWSSDLFYEEALYRDGILGQAALRDFHFSACPFVLPDFPLYSLLRSIFSNVNLVFWTYLLASLGVLRMLIKQWMGEHKSVYAAPIFVLCAFVGFFNVQWDTILFPVHHGGQYLLGMLLIQPLLLGETRPLFQILAAAVCGTLVASDPLFAINVIAPLGAYSVLTFLLTRKTKPFFRQILFLAGAAASSVIAYFSIHYFTQAHFGWNKPYFDSAKASSFASGFLKFNFFNAALLFSFVYVIFKCKKDPLARFFLVSSVTSVLFVSLTGSWTDSSNVRYLNPLLLMMLYAWFKLLSERRIKLFACASVLLITYRASVFAKIDRVNPFLKPYAPSVACLDQIVREEHLHEGVSSYVMAKYVSFQSQENVKVLQATSELTPIFWINSEAPYRNFHPSFILVDPNFQPGSRILSQFALSPTRKVDCFEFSVWIYPAPFSLTQ